MEKKTKKENKYGIKKVGYKVKKKIRPKIRKTQKDGILNSETEEKTLR